MTPFFDPVQEAKNKLRKCQFDKYKGELWVDVIEFDRPYVEWLTEQEWLREDLYEYLMELLEGD